MSSSVIEAQTPLRARYKASPPSATVTSQAFTGGFDLTDPMGADAEAMVFGVHRSVGSPHALPCPGDLMCAALAACQDASIRMVADAMGITLRRLEVHVQGTLDVRGALGMQRDVPVGFQSLVCDIHLEAADGTPADQLEKLRLAAERCCVVAQTLQSPPLIQTRFHV
jgi:uncharacterized OsmC-like protein